MSYATMSSMRKTFALMLCLTLALVLPGAAVAKQDVLVELFYSSAWHDVSSRVYTRDPITINHGAGDEQTGVIPSDASLTFTNRDGEMNPENRKSSLFGLIGRNTPIRITVGSDVRFSGQAVSWKPRRAAGTLDSTRGDAWVQVQAQGTIRRLGQGEPPVRSPLFRSTSGITANDYVPHEYWSWEDGSQATQIASAVAGSSAITPVDGVGITFASDGPVGSLPLPRLAAGFSATIPIAAYTDAGKWAITFVMNVPAEPAATTTVFEVPVTGSTAERFKFEIVPGAPATIWWRAYDSAGALIALYSRSIALDGASDRPTEAQFFSDDWYLFTVDSSDLAGDDQVGIGMASGDLILQDHQQFAPVGTTHGSLSGTIVMNVDANLAGVGFGHLAVFTDAAYDIDFDVFHNAPALIGWSGETAGARFNRLCVEESIASTVVGSANDTQAMGPQPTDTLLKVFEDIAKTDAGIIHDTRDQLGLTFRTGRSLYNQ